MIGRLLELFEGPEAPGPWAPPAMPAALHALLPWRAFDESSETYVNAASAGFVIELPPFAGIDAETLGALAGTLADAAPERCTIQVIHWASPRFGAASRAWAEPRAEAGGALARMGTRRRDLLSSGGWRRLHGGGPPFTLSDYRVFVTASLRAGGPGPATETALGAFRRALEGTLASAGATTRRLEPDALLSLAAELMAPDIGGYRDGGTERPPRRWAPRDPLHEQCTAPGRALSVHPTGLAFHHPDAEDIAVRVLSAITFPEVWPGWRGNALIGDFHRDFLQPGCPVLTCLTDHDRRRGGGREGVPQVRPRHAAGRHRHRQVSPRPAREGARLAGGDRPDQGRREAGPRLLHGGGLRAAGRSRRGRAGGPRDLSRPGLAGERGALHAAPLLAGVPADGVRRRLDADLERMGRMKTLLTSSAVNLAPLHGEWRGQPANPDNPPALFLIGRRGQPACWSPFANDAGNYNVAVTGKSGSGKSVLMQELVTGLIGAGGEAVVIDDGRSFQHTAEALEGAFIAFGKDPACLNPFAMIDAGTAEHDGDYREECFAMLAGVIGRMARRRGSIDDIEAALIAEAIAAAWDEAGNDADLGTVRKNLEARDDRRAADMATSLGPWCPGGAMGRLFAGSNVPDLENALTVFELAELKGRGDVQAVVLMLVVFLATQRMYHGPRTRAKAIVIDEAWDLLSGEDSKAFLEGAARRARKYRGALVTGTQSVNDYYANPAARAAWENSDWVIFLAQKDESVELLKSEKRIHCDPGMERALKSLTTADGRYAEIVLHGPDGWRVARLVLDAWSVALFSSRGPAFAAVETLKAQGTQHGRGHRPARRGGRPRGYRAFRND